LFDKCLEEWQSMKNLLPAVFIALAVISCSCDTTEPPLSDNIPPGRRDYSWTVDTLNYPYNTITRIWGSSPSDVWAISSGGDLDKTIFHFDGNNWTTDFISRPISPHSIFGFAPDDIWMGGGNGKIWRYNGSSWYESAVLTKDGNTQIVFDNLWGESPNDLYAIGTYPGTNGYATKSVIAHYENDWRILNTDGIRGIVEHLHRDKYDGKIYLQVPLPGAGIHFDSTQIFQYTPDSSKLLYRSVWTRGKEADISLIDGRVYFILGQEIALRNDNQFKTFLKIDNPSFYQRIWGRSNRDIYLFMTNGLVHYNGVNFDYLLTFNNPRTFINGAALFDQEVFFIVYESFTNLNLIYHGILTE
jgi:hypothetical protein